MNNDMRGIFVLTNVEFLIIAASFKERIKNVQLLINEQKQIKQTVKCL